MSTKRTVLFDLDGTLTDSFAGIGRSLSHAVGHMGVIAPSDLALRACVGPPVREGLSRLLGTNDPEHIERALIFYRERYSLLGWKENQVYAGIESVLTLLGERGYRMFVCTSKPSPYAERIVEYFGLAPHFDGIYGARLDGGLDDKSRIVALLLASERLDAAQCVMIGDRAHDINAARTNNVTAVGALWGYGSRVELEQAGAQAVLSAPAEIPAYLLTLE